MGKFQPGESGNKAGRPKGSANVLTKELRSKLKDLLDHELDGLPELLDGLPPDKRLDIIIKLLGFVMPKITPVCASNGEPMDTNLLDFDSHFV